MRSNLRKYAGNAAIAVLAVFLFLAVIGLFAYDVYKTWSRVSSEPPAMEMARKALAQVNDPANGWFPFKREPAYDWENGPQGWMLEDEVTLLKGQNVARTVAADPDTDLPPGITETAGIAAPGPVGKLGISKARASQGRNALSIPVRFPDPVTIFRDNSKLGDEYKMIGVRFIAYDVYIPDECPGFVGCLFFMKDKDGLWYQARSRAALMPGQWTTVTADIRGGSPDVTPLGHQGQWDDNQASQIRTLGLTFYGDKPFNGSILLDNFRGWVRPAKFIQANADNPKPKPITTAGPIAKAGEKPSVEKLEELAQKYKEPPLHVLNLRTDPTAPIVEEGKPALPPSVPKLETFTLRFELNRLVGNPFDPAQADIVCDVETPRLLADAAGKPILDEKGQPKHEVIPHVAFWYQDYDRSDRFSGDDLAPIGRPEWRVRITPRVEGTYTYTLKIKMFASINADGTTNYDTLTVPARTFVATPSNEKGFVRVSKQNPHFFEFENGDFYYPVGHNLHSPVDMRCWQQILKSEAPAGRGLPMYEDFFPKMKAAGENTAEVWMASWWLAIEWTSEWRDYYGRGRYSLQHAWKLDKLLEMARENGIHIHLVLDNHGKFSTYCDWEWDLNPYNSRRAATANDNGVALDARDFFGKPAAILSHKNKLRYIAARWGPDPTILGFELVSEFDLVGGDPKAPRVQSERGSPSSTNGFHRSPVARKWVHEMIDALKNYDVYDHMVTNHYATDYRWIDVELAKDKGENGAPLFDYVVTDAYRKPRPGGYVVPANAMQLFYDTSIGPYAPKPFWITEYGGDFDGATETCLDADVHCGLWSTWMTDGAGTPLCWWFDFIDQRNLYTYYGAFSKYIAGEDRRIQNGVHGMNEKDKGVGFQWFKWKTGAYAWAYDPEGMRSMPPPGKRQHFQAVTESLKGFSAGKYRIEYWDCYTGAIVLQQEATVAEGGTIQLSFPPFENNMAVKVKLTK